MASASASTSLGVRRERPSFAKIAAAGIKPPSAQQHSNPPTSNDQKHDMISPPQDGTTIVTPSTEGLPSPPPPKQRKIVQLAGTAPTVMNEENTNGPRVRVQIVESVPQRLEEPAPEGLLAPCSDDVGTQVSSSSGSNKPQSLDGKSVASGTTFALDEKDSLRPDDSASVKAVEEDDVFSAQSSGLPGSRMGSDDGARAFRDQLREISAMEPQRRPPPPTLYNGAPKGVLYVPPPGPGVGTVPNGARMQSEDSPPLDLPPDQKLIDALENPRDRVWVLKLEQDVIDFVKDPKESSLILPQCHAFYRLLAHKMADYYMLGHFVEDTSSAVRLFKTPHCRIPPPLTGITAPSTAASTPPPVAPQMKILRRGIDKAGPAIANGSTPSKNGSENGDSGNEDDKKPKGPITREEREARYEAARLRIMGSAKPTDSPEAPKEKQDSRSSSTTGKAKKKKQRADSDDGFEARSAFSNYYVSPFGTDGLQATAYFPEYTDSSNAHYPNAYVQSNQPMAMSQASMQSGNLAWAQQAHGQESQTPSWVQGQNGSYDLSTDFQRSLSFQNQVPSPTGNMTFSAAYGQQYYATQQQGWTQQQYQAPAQMAQSGYGYSSSYSANPSQMQPLDQPYAYGQLPSQAFPGRPASKTEHPLPGSYKGKHFNPQSQSFIPGQTSGRPFSPQGMSGPSNSYASGFPGPAQLQRQGSAQSHNSAFGSSHHSSPHAAHQRVQVVPLTHPLPQPVFPRQPSPNVPLPPKPGSGSHRIGGEPSPQTISSPAAHTQSVIAKWGTPASLPAKPPPPSAAESFEANKLAQMPRPTYQSAAAAARQPPGSSHGGASYSPFGSLPSGNVSGGTAAQIVNGSGTSVKRT